MSTNANIESALWAAADRLWADTGLKPSEFSTPVLGLIFLRYAEKRFDEVTAAFEQSGMGRRRSGISKAAYQEKGVMFLPEVARFSYIRNLPEDMDLGLKVNEAMKAVEEENPDLAGVLPKNYRLLSNRVIVELLKLLSGVNIEGDAFGKVYEYFLGNFAMAEGRKGGVFYTPTSIVRLIVEILEPYDGRIFDPACGSGGMFVQSAKFIQHHNGERQHHISLYGTEKETATLKLAKMNLAVHGLGGDIRVANTYYEDPHKCLGKFDFVMANPPFNVSGVDKERLENDPRFPFGIPSTDNANYLWIQLFYSALNEAGRAGFVMANSAGDARSTEATIRRKLVKAGVVDVVVAVGPNFFYTVTLPCTLWFLDKGKKGSDRENTVLFIDVRHIYRQLDRAHRDFLPEQIEFIANIVRLYRGQKPEIIDGSNTIMKEHSLCDGYKDVPGLCRAVTIQDIENETWSLNPSRYVGTASHEIEDVDFFERLGELNEELESLNSQSKGLEEQIANNVAWLLETQA